MPPGIKQAPSGVPCTDASLTEALKAAGPTARAAGSGRRHCRRPDGVLLIDQPIRHCWAAVPLQG